MISCDPGYSNFLSKMTGAKIGIEGQCIVDLYPDASPRAGVLFEGYNQQIIFAHIWIDEGARPDKGWLAAIFDFPFNRLGVRKIIGQVKSDNEEAIRLDKHFGFELEATVKDYFEDGVDLLVFTMTKEQCRVLNNPRWQKYVELAARAK